MPKRIDITNQQFGTLKVIGLSDRKNETGTVLWECLCTACEKKIYLPGFSLRHGHYKSCGCQQEAKRDRGARDHEQSDRIDGTRRTALRAKIHKGNKSGHKGVRWEEKKQSWKAYIGFQGKQISLGYHPTKELAIAARLAGEEKYHKPYLEDEEK